MMISLIFASLLQLQSPSLDESFASALATAGLTTTTAKFDPGMVDIYRQGEFPIPLYLAINENPWRMPFMAAAYRADLDKQTGVPTNSLVTLARMAGFGTRRTLLGNPIEKQVAEAKKPGELASVLASMKQSGQISGPIPSLNNVPQEVQQAAALVLKVTQSAIEYRRLTFQGIDLPAAYQTLLKMPDEADSAAFQAQLAISRKVELGYMSAGAHDLTLAAQTAADMVGAVKPDVAYDFKVSTSLGSIELTGGSDSAHAAPTLLIIDTGGNDTYLNTPSNASAENPVSVVIDTSGNDKYVSDPALAETKLQDWAGRKGGGNLPGPGGALLGYSILIDCAGHDLYRTHRPGLACGRYGFAVLLDKAGNDIYDAYQNAEGYGEFGTGLLEDVAGNDQYDIFTQGQGYGYVMGAGALIDRQGADRYTANDTVIDFPSAQSDKHNNSMAQGVGNGFRRDYLDVHSLAGGVGLLYDVSGDDSYSCSVFGQGSGYWEGVGMLWDGAGNDTYLGQWYVQGAAAHFAVGYLEDLGGEDHYTAPMNMAQGAGHDFSIGYLIDHAGNDTYKAPNLSLGAGNDNGIGIFVDMAGDDIYESSGTTLGKANPGAAGTMRERAFSFGFFLDMGGKDTYPAAAPWAENGKQAVNWTVHAPSLAESQYGIFWDR